MVHNATDMSVWVLVGAYLLGFVALQAYLYSDRSLPVGTRGAPGGAPDPTPTAGEVEYTRCEECGTVNRADAAFSRCRECADQL